MLKKYFEDLCASLKLDNFNDMKSTSNNIGSKLDSHYYEEQKNEMIIVGSVGRKTAIKNCSDLDLLYKMPCNEYERFDNYEGNGQSALLQEVKKILQEKYPKTEIKGDGQVVVIDFNKYTIELVPAFEQSDGSFKYPDTHDGGSWKYTKPIIEQNTAGNAEIKSNYNYYNICRMIRCWKNNCNFHFKGLLIDTLVYNVFAENDYFSISDYNDYWNILTKVFEYMKGLDREQKYWKALGSNQYIYNDDHALFVAKASTAYDLLANNEPSECILDKLFDKDKESENNSRVYHKYDFTEQFIHNKFNIDIRYNLSIECEVSADGLRTILLDKYLSHYGYLKKSRKLVFRISKTNCPEPFDIYWKVRNVGRVAEDRNDIRGQIVKGGNIKTENSKFYGPHFVECYLVKNNICVARKRIDVPIGND